MSNPALTTHCRHCHRYVQLMGWSEWLMAPNGRSQLLWSRPGAMDAWWASLSDQFLVLETLALRPCGVLQLPNLQVEKIIVMVLICFNQQHWSVMSAWPVACSQCDQPTGCAPLLSEHTAFHLSKWLWVIPPAVNIPSMTNLVELLVCSPRCFILDG